MTVITRQHVTDVFATPVREGNLVPVDKPSPTRVTEPEPRTLFVRPMPDTGCECDTDVDDAVRSQIQDLVNEHSRHLCVCSPNRAERLAAQAEMKAHPGYAAYKARRDATMAGYGNRI